MGTSTRPELSERNQWYIDKHRYYELKHFCLQYQDWEAAVREIDGLPSMSAGRTERINPGKTGDPTAVMAEARMQYANKIDLVRKTAYETCGHQFWYTFLVRAVTEEVSYDTLEAQNGIMPIARGAWYDLYRKFFWMLDKVRD